MNMIARKAGIQERILCHSSRRETLLYIGVVQEEIDESLMKFKLVGRRSA